MNLDSVRKFCLAFPDATENLQWEQELCFKVRGKIFAMVAVDSVPPTLIFKCDLETFSMLTERDGIVPAPYVGRFKWVQLQRLDALPDSELKELLGQSFAMVSAKAKGRRTAKPKRRKTHVSRNH